MMLHIVSPQRVALAFLFIFLLCAPLGSPIMTARAAALDPLFAVASPGPGLHTCTRTDPCALQAAVDGAAIGVTIYTAGGKYTSTANAVLNLNKSVRIEGGWSGGTEYPIVVNPKLYPTILDGNDAHRGIIISGDVSPTLRGLTIQNGRATAANGGAGGGIYISNSISGDVKIDNCIIHNNEADWYGGAIYHTYGTLTLTNSRIFNNQVGFGGGAFFAAQGSSVTVENSEIYNNPANYGDLIDVDDANFTLRRSYIHDNPHAENPQDRSVISIGSEPGLHIIIENNIFVANEAKIINAYSAADVSILHNTFAGGGADGLSITAAGSTGSVQNNIFTDLAGASIYLPNGSSLTISHNLFWQNGSNPNTGSVSMAADPLLTSNFHLSRWSPAVDAGTATSITNDYDGDLRPMGSHPDIGADESPLYVDLPFISR